MFSIQLRGSHLTGAYGQHQTARYPAGGRSGPAYWLWDLILRVFLLGAKLQMTNLLKTAHFLKLLKIS